MAIRLTCPTCEKPVFAKDDMAGKKARCPHCSTVISFGDPSSSGSHAAQTYAHAPGDLSEASDAAIVPLADASPPPAPAARRPSPPPPRTPGRPAPAPAATQTPAPQTAPATPQWYDPQPAYAPAPQAPRCPSCQAMLAPGATWCVACGFNLATGKHMTAPREEPPGKLLGTLTSPAFWGITLLILLLIGGGTGVMIYLANRQSAPASKSATAQPAPPSRLGVLHAGGGGGGAVTPAMGSRPSFRQIQPDIDRADVSLSGSGPAANMKLRFYLPHRTTSFAPRSLGCIFIAPAGTPMIHGSSLGDESDSPEHIPYVRAGYAVCAYELDGDVSKGASDATLLQAIKAFRAANYGVANARNAINYVLAQFPEVNPDRLYAAGHSSAGGVALSLAAQEPRIKACLAYAPGTDIAARIPSNNVDEIARVLPEFRQVVRDASPITHVGAMNCPIFLFHASDDTVVARSEIDAFTNALRSRGKNPVRRDVATGDHYDSMIQQGIPAGIEFLRSLPAERAAGPVSSSPPVTSAAPGGAEAAIANSDWSAYTIQLPASATLASATRSELLITVRDANAEIGRITMTLLPPVPKPTRYPSGTLIGSNNFLFHRPLGPSPANALFRYNGYGEHHAMTIDVNTTPDKAGRLNSVTVEILRSIRRK